jgi:hypothetical protein
MEANVKFKFTKGDRVRVIEHELNDEEIPVGSTGTVAENDSMPWVVMDNEALNIEIFLSAGGVGYPFHQDELELIESEATNA